MIPVHESPLGHLNNARVIAHGIADGYLGRGAIETLRLMVMDVRNAVFHADAEAWVVVETWLAQATEIIDTVAVQGRPMDDLDLGALKECLAEAARVLR